MKTNHETILQTLIASGIGLTWMVKNCDMAKPQCMDGRDKPICEITLERTNEMIERFRNLPDGEKAILNRLMGGSVKTMVCGSCFHKYNPNACPLCNHEEGKENT